MKKEKKSPEELGLANYTLAQELWNAISHGLGALFGLFALIILLIKIVSGDHSESLYALKIVSAVFYSSSIMICMSISCIYHSLAKNRGKKVLRTIDHAMIYLLVAGSYAPFCLVAMISKGALLWNIPNTEWSGYLILGLCYICIILGATFASINFKKYDAFSMVMYLVGGLMILVNPTGIYNALGFYGFLFLALGGVFYVIGSVLYGIGKHKSLWWHTVFHFFCLFGIVSMFISIYFFVY